MRQAEGALRASELLYRSVVDNLAKGVVVQDAAGHIVASNPAAREILGLTVDQLTGRTSFDPQWHAVWADGTPTDGSAHPATIARTTGRAVTDVVMGVRNASGVTRWLQVSARPLRETSEDPISGVVVSFLDISERRRSEQALRDAEAILNQTQALTKVGGWAYDVAANRVIWTDEVYRIHELPRDYDPNSAEQDIEFYAPVDRVRIAEAFRLSFEEGRPYDLELRLVTAKGREIWVRSVGQPQVEDGRVVRVYGTIADITEQRRADDEIRVTHARLRRFIDANMLGVVIGDASGAIVEANDHFLDLIGYTRAQLEAGEIDWRAITPTEWLPVSERAVIEQRERGVSTPYEKEYQRRDGGRVPVLVGGTTLPGPGGEIAAFAIDISDRKRAEARIAERQALLQNLIEGAEAAIFAVDSQYSYTIFNTQHADIMRALYGVDIELGRNLLDYQRSSGDHVQAKKNLDRALTGERFTDEGFSGEEERTRAYFEVTHGPVRDEHGEIVGAAVFARDTTTQRRAEEQIRGLTVELEQRVVARTAALEAANRELEAFSYSVSHDLRAPLRAIDGFSTILLRGHADQLDSEGQRLLGIVLRNVGQMGVLIDDLLGFSRVARQELDSRPVEMGKLARLVTDELAAAEPGRVIEFELGDLCIIPGDASLLRQVWTNLLGNAAKFTRLAERPRIEVGCEQVPGECRYTVRDNGVGFDPAYAGNLFQPFQRLHPTAEFEGTGIGLAIVARIVQRHGGRVWAESMPGAGATFGFALPTETETP